MEADTEAQRSSRGCPRSHSQSWYVAIGNLSSLTPAYALLSLLMGLRVPTWRGEQRPGIEMTQDQLGEGGPGVPS